MKKEKKPVVKKKTTKKKKISKNDFIAAMTTAHLDPKQQRNILSKFDPAIPKLLEFIGKIFLSDDMKESYTKLLLKNLERVH